jgi:hypothetical protein
VVGARADDAGGDAPDRDAEDEVPIAAAARPATPVSATAQAIASSSISP